MATIDGGILGGNREEIARGSAELERKEAAAVELAAQQELATNRIEDALTALLRDELAAEIATRKRLSPETMRAYRTDFTRFKKCCGDWKLPYLPASPQVVAAWLGEEGPRGLAHVLRCKAAISAAHRAADLDDPFEDLLVRAVIRMVRDDKSPSTAKPST